jgi:hypothetical protein
MNNDSLTRRRGKRASLSMLASVLVTTSVSAFWIMSSSADPAAAPGFDQTLELQGISFRISSPNNSSLNPVTIEVTGLELGDNTLSPESDGTVTGAQVADLDGNGSPEIYIYTTSAGSGSYGDLIAYAANNRKSLSEIYLPPLSESEDAALGYMGHDTFAITENSLVRRFPVYLAEDTNATPSGGLRQLSYQLEPGEAGWVLRLTTVSGGSQGASTLGHSSTPPDQQ